MRKVANAISVLWGCRSGLVFCGFIVAVCLALLGACQATCARHTPTRVVLRSDGQYEVERQYGMLGWSKMGGPYTNMTQALKQVAYWDAYDQAKLANQQLKRRVVWEQQ